MLRLLILISSLILTAFGVVLPAQVQQYGRNVSLETYRSLEELARIVDISYCVGSSGIWKPFRCLSRCNDFPGFELVTTWNTGPLLSDSCGYIALSHEPFKKRVIVAFRGTYSIANTIADLSTLPAHYVPFPGENDKDAYCLQTPEAASSGPLVPQLIQQRSEQVDEETCTNCTVHLGFMSSWHNTRCVIIPEVEKALKNYPDYELTLVGHSLGGAVAALAALEFEARGWTPHVTTFGEPRIGNKELSQFIDTRFNLNADNPDEARYRRVTHVSDPVPLLPAEEWGYRMHAGEIYISKSSVPPSRNDLQHCVGDADPQCIENEEAAEDKHWWSVSPRYRAWQLFFAHRDYFWRLGLCLPEGGPWEWREHWDEFEKYGSNEMADEIQN